MLTIARPLRIEYPGAFYHVVQRGNEKRERFTSDSDRERFLSYLENLNTRYHVKVHTYCLMDNHYHLLIETPDANLVKAMHSLKHQLHPTLIRGRIEVAIYFKGDIKAY